MPNPLLPLLLLVASVGASGQLVSSLAHLRDNEKDEPKEWEGCDTFLAPSSVEGSGWGVFAGRSFKKNEIVEIAPLVLAVDEDAPIVKNSVLNDYIYGSVRYNYENKQLQHVAAVVFGNTMFYNHLATPNIAWLSFGREPASDGTIFTEAAGFGAIRDIDAGEELFSTYGLEDGGKQWFADRKLEQRASNGTASRKTGVVFAADSAKYCAKTLAGIGEPGWSKVNQELAGYGQSSHTISMERLHASDNTVTISKHDVLSGAVLEMAPALILNKAQVQNSLLAPFCIYWSDLNFEQQTIMAELYEKNEWIVQYQGWDTGWVRTNRINGWDEMAILPAAGNIGLVLKMSPTEGHKVSSKEAPNCKLEITSSGSLTSAGGVENTGSAGIILSLIATRDIESGEILRVDLIDTSTDFEKKLLYIDMKSTGRPIPDHLQPVMRENVKIGHEVSATEYNVMMAIFLILLLLFMHIGHSHIYFVLDRSGRRPHRGQDI
jgi:SET domain